MGMDLQFYEQMAAELERYLEQFGGLDDEGHDIIENSVAYCHRKIAQLKREAKYAQYLRVRREIIARN